MPRWTYKQTFCFGFSVARIVRAWTYKTMYTILKWHNRYCSTKLQICCLLTIYQSTTIKTNSNKLDEQDKKHTHKIQFRQFMASLAIKASDSKLINLISNFIPQISPLDKFHFFNISSAKDDRERSKNAFIQLAQIDKFEPKIVYIDSMLVPFLLSSFVGRLSFFFSSYDRNAELETTIFFFTNILGPVQYWLMGQNRLRSQWP